MAIPSVLDPSVKFQIIDVCFPSIYKLEEVAKENIIKVRESLQKLYDEYVALSLEELSSMEVDIGTNNPTSSTTGNTSIMTSFNQILSIVREKEVIPPLKSELSAYLHEGIYNLNSNTNSFSALKWWRNNNMKYNILSKMVADILAIPISTMATESAFSASSRVIDEFRSRLNEESIEALICGGDWLRHKYNLKKKIKG